jgi:hypothetical protein
MPLNNLAILTVLFIVAAGFYYFRDDMIGALRRFDARNRARRAEEIQARYDRSAHYRHTLALADEQIEEVSRIRVKDPRTGGPIERYLFLGEEFATLKEAEEARFAAVVGKARDFYRDIDRIYLARSDRRREAMGAGPEEDGS